MREGWQYRNGHDRVTNSAVPIFLAGMVYDSPTRKK